MKDITKSKDASKILDEILIKGNKKFKTEIKEDKGTNGTTRSINETTKSKTPKATQKNARRNVATLHPSRVYLSQLGFRSQRSKEPTIK